MAYNDANIQKKRNPKTKITLSSLRVFLSCKAQDLQLKNVSSTIETDFPPPLLRVILYFKRLILKI